MPQSLTEKRKFNSFDIVKFFMALCVIAIHTNPVQGLQPSVFTEIYETVVRSANCFFFLCSGYLLANKLEFPFNSEKDIRTIKAMINRMIKMYLIWSLIYLPLAVIHYIDIKISPAMAVVSYLRSFVFLGEHYNSWMLWYLLSTIYTLVMVLILMKKKVSPYIVPAIGFILTLTGILFDYFDPVADTLPAVPAFIHKILHYTFSSGKVFMGYFFIPCGMLLNKKKFPLSVSIIVFLIFASLRTAVSNYLIENLLLIVYSVAFFGIVEKINLKDRPFYPVMRKMSTYMYYMHMYVWVILTYILYREERLGFIPFAATAAVTVLISFICVRIKPLIIKKTSKH